MQARVARQNLKKLKNSPESLISKKECNCPKGKTCIVKWSCNVKDVIYKATLTNTSTQQTSTYVGACSTTFKLTHSNHKQSFNKTRGLQIRKGSIRVTLRSSRVTLWSSWVTLGSYWVTLESPWVTLE